MKIKKDNFKRKEYDYLIIGAGLFGSVFAHEMCMKGKRCLVIDKRGHIGGNVYTENIEGINVHKYGAHIFHTSNKKIWDYMNSFSDFNNFVNSPLACFNGKLYNLPFNMNTFYQLWGVRTPSEAKNKINEQRAEYSHIACPKNLEEQALLLVGKDIYKKLIEGYTVKQWGRPAKELPAFIIRRLPLRFTFDNNYYNDFYQGIPKDGYTPLVKALLNKIEVKTNVNYFENRKHFDLLAKRIVYTGKIDEYFGYTFGKLEYRSLYFESDLLDQENYQGNAVVNFTDVKIPYTRIIEHKHFEFGTQKRTYVTREYPHEFSKEKEPYYPVIDETNQKMLRNYMDLVKGEKKTYFGGRLAEYKYYDMHDVIKASLELVHKISRGNI